MDKKELTIVKYWRKNSWPYSIDTKIEGATLCTMEIELDKEVVFMRNGKRYLYWPTGHGTSTTLLIDEK